MNRSAAALLALVAGILVGAGIRASGSVALSEIAYFLLPIGVLWLNALKMTLVPLVFATVANGMITLDRRGGGGLLLGITLPILFGLLASAMLLGMAFGIFFQSVWPIAPGTLAALGAPSAPPVQQSASVFELIVGLVPTNPVAAATNGAMASIVVFAVVFGFAVSRTSSEDDEPVARFIAGLAAAMLCLVHWVLRLTPLGIFMLSMGLALNIGLAIAGFVAQIVVASIIAALIAITLGYLLAWLAGAVTPLRFGKAVIGVQVMAAGTCSSAASLPAMIEASERKLGIDPAIGGAVLPLAVSIFRFSVALYQGALIVLFMIAMGLPLDSARLFVAGALLILGTMGGAGLPGAAVIYTSWIAALQFLGLPVELVPIMIAANALPDIFVTAGNVTAHMAVTAIIARLLAKKRPDELSSRLGPAVP